MRKLLDNLSWKQKLSIAMAAVGVLAAILFFTRWNHERDFRPLYSSLSAEDAAAVLAKVREGGGEFRLADNGATILAPAAKVAELRLQMAAAGIPKSGRIGFELFDKANFGSSDFAEQVNYHRALEGELERSVMSLSAVEQARVHLTFPKESVFTESRQPAKASVLVKLRSGAQLSAQNVNAICQLTASAVEGLSPESVAVLDMRGNLLNRARKPASPDDAEPSEAALDYRQKIERDLLAKINGTLEPLLGSNKFRATASAECDFSSGEQSDEMFDPTKSVMMVSQKTEDVSGSNLASGSPGVASNLPRPTSRPGSGGTGVARRTENITYQSNHSVRHMKLPQGTVKRLSIALLVDNDVRFEGTAPKLKRVVEAPSAARLKTLHDLVAGVVGLSAERGDQLVVESLAFESTMNPEIIPEPPPVTVLPKYSVPPWLDKWLHNKYVLIGAGVFGVLMLAGLFFIFRRMGKKKRAQAAAALEVPAAIEGMSIGDQMEKQLADQDAVRLKQESEALNSLKVAPVTKKAEVLKKHIAEQAKKDSTSMAHVLRTWMNEGRKSTA